MKLQEKRDFYKSEISNIVAKSYNREQKQLAYDILDNATENNIDALYTFITQRVKLGFTFDAAPEVNHNCVALCKRNNKLSFGTLGNKHKMIIGENYDALKNLLVTYTKNGKGLIDVIYIDPPYNTEKSKEEGNDYKDDVKSKKFIYRDKFTRNGWLNMMNERLKLAKKLLSDKGVIFISVDDNMQAYLKVLCDDIFGEENFESFIWKKKGGAGNTEKIIGCLTEYILCYFKKKEPGIFNYRKIERIYKYKDEKGYYKLEGIEKTNLGIYKRSTMLFTIIDDKTRTEFMPSKDMRWTEGKEAIAKLKAEKRLFFDYKKNKVQIKKYAENYELSENVYYNLLMDLGSLSTAKNELKDIIGDRELFETPKPTELIKHLFEISSKGNSIVLDFFAGSGTTGQAVMELNQEDGGNRKCILVANNENNIGKEIMYERIFRVVNGKGTKGEKFDWTYSKDKPYLAENSWDVFEIEYNELKIDDFDKAEKLLKEAETEFKNLNSEYEKKDLDIYNQLASLNPYKKDGE